MVHSLHEAADHPGGVLVIRVQQHEREQALIRQAEHVGVAHLVADDLRDFADRALVGGHAHAVELADGFHRDERQVVLRAHGTPQLAVEHELEGMWLQQPRMIVEEGIGHGQRQEALSRPFSLIL